MDEAAESGWIAVCDLDRLQAETIVRIAGRDLLVIWNDGYVVACDRACPHEQADLGLGQVTAGRLLCPRHAASFDLRDGAIAAGWPSPPLRLYPAKVEGGQIWIEAGERRPGR
ncbi:Rieske (2Fe-2S) protein [Bradyrhizobium campsiandrae]|uniref:Rieske (2Fe-2S) protein n=1 Tax=Bradyrhizobium campsiandrae TaxID=1729892 RepID=UPI0028A03BD2|nr:Rieske (2Fe-2S) protein [Bradyrhizobium campsiandrae]